MPKLNAFLRKKFEAAGIRGDDVEALLSASGLAEFELTDQVAKQWDEAYFTKERALNDSSIVSEIQKKAKAQVFNRVDELFEPYYDLLSPEKAAEIGKEVNGVRSVYNTNERIEKLREALGARLKETSTKVSEDVQKVEAEWSKKYKDFQELSKKEKADLVNAHKDENVNFGIKTRLAGYKLTDAYKPQESIIHDLIIAKVKKFRHNGNPAIIERDEDGNLLLKQSVEGTLRDIYIKDNDKLTLEKLLDQEIEPFIVKSNGVGSTENGSEGNHTRQTPAFVDTSKMTLDQIRQAKYAVQ